MTTERAPCFVCRADVILGVPEPSGRLPMRRRDRVLHPACYDAYLAGRVQRQRTLVKQNRDRNRGRSVAEDLYAKPRS